MKVAENIFEETIENFDLIDGTDSRREFEEAIRNKIVELEEFRDFPITKDSEALSYYSQKIQNEVINPLVPRESNPQNRRARNQENRNTRNDSAFLINLTMKLNRKLPHEICRDDVLRAVHFEGDIIENTLSEVFMKYKVEQYSWAHTLGEESQVSFQNLMSRYRKEKIPPWEVLRENLDQMREAAGDLELFNFEFSDPEGDKINFTEHSQYSFEAKMINRATGDSYPATSLSSGEKILMTLCLSSFNQSIGRRQPKLILLDELDSVLHPSMISALIAGLKTLFVENGTKVIMATHSVTTAAMFEEDKIYRMGRNNNKIAIRPVTKSEAVSELSEGLATIDTGLRIAASSAKPITILTEGKNALHLKKWASLFYSEDVYVFDELPDKTNDKQLKTYGQFLSKMNTNSHFLIVWDCDANGIAEKLADELPESAKVAAFAFEQRENNIAPKGIENKYDEETLKPYANRTTEMSTGEEVSLSFSSRKKTQFAEHIFANGTKEDFQYFDDLESTVMDILERLPSQNNTNLLGVSHPCK